MAVYLGDPRELNRQPGVYGEYYQKLDNEQDANMHNLMAEWDVTLANRELYMKICKACIKSEDKDVQKWITKIMQLHGDTPLDMIKSKRKK